jgi:hypothetical protein
MTRDPGPQSRTAQPGAWGRQWCFGAGLVLHAQYLVTAEWGLRAPSLSPGPLALEVDCGRRSRKVGAEETPEGLMRDASSLDVPRRERGPLRLEQRGEELRTRCATAPGRRRGKGGRRVRKGAARLYLARSRP